MSLTRVSVRFGYALAVGLAVRIHSIIVAALAPKLGSTTYIQTVLLDLPAQRP